MNDFTTEALKVRNDTFAERFVKPINNKQAKIQVHQGELELITY